MEYTSLHVTIQDKFFTRVAWMIKDSTAHSYKPLPGSGFVIPLVDNVNWAQ
jgi:hypothetical protein